MNVRRLAGIHVGLLISVMVLAAPVLAQAQDCYPVEITKAVGAELHSASVEQMQITELPKLNDEVIALEQINQSGNGEIRVARFYEITRGTYQIVQGKVISESVQLDNDSTWIVSLGPDRTLYKLRGFSDPLSGFNTLIKDLAVHVSKPEGALAVFYLFAKTGHSPDFFSSLVGDNMQLQSAALQDFRLRFPEGKRQLAYEKWIKRMPKRIAARIVPPQIRVASAGFEITYYRYSEGRLSEASVNVSAEGIVSPKTVRVVYEK